MVGGNIFPGGGFAVPAGTPANSANSSSSGEDPLKLGGLTIENFAAPDELAIGLQKAFCIHDFPGGERELQIWGEFYKSITWTGLLLGSDAEDRAHQLETFMKRKSSKVLEWRGYRLDVEIVDFVAKILWRNEIEYTIEVVPYRVQNAAGGNQFNSPEAILDASFAQASEAAGGQSPPFELQAAKEQIDDLQDLVEQNLKESNGKVSDIDPSIRLFLATQAATINSGLFNIMQSSGPVISSKAADLRTYMQVVQNTLNAPEKQYKMVRYINPNLLKIASAEYGDASLWTVIRDANGLVDQVLVGEYVLKIPLNPTTAQTTTQPVF